MEPLMVYTTVTVYVDSIPDSKLTYIFICVIQEKDCDMEDNCETYSNHRFIVISPTQ